MWNISSRQRVVQTRFEVGFPYETNKTFYTAASAAGTAGWSTHNIKSDVKPSNTPSDSALNIFPLSDLHKKKGTPDQHQVSGIIALSRSNIHHIGSRPSRERIHSRTRVLVKQCRRERQQRQGRRNTTYYSTLNTTQRVIDTSEMLLTGVIVSGTLVLIDTIGGARARYL